MVFYIICCFNLLVRNQVFAKLFFQSFKFNFKQWFIKKRDCSKKLAEFTSVKHHHDIFATLIFWLINQ